MALSYDIKMISTCFNKWPTSFYIKSTTNDILQNMLLYAQVKVETVKTL